MMTFAVETPAGDWHIIVTEPENRKFGRFETTVRRDDMGDYLSIATDLGIDVHLCRI